MTIWIIIGIVAIAVLFCFLLAIANFSGERFFERYEEIDRIVIEGNSSPMQFVADLNKKHFNDKLNVIQISELASDCYSKGKLFLSWKTLSKNSIASFTIIAHELGHALQDKEGKKLKNLIALRKIGRFLGMFFVPTIIAGLVLLVLNILTWAIILLAVGGGIFLLALIIKLLTISLEKDASEKALDFLKDYLAEGELKIAKKFANDAKLTYWADFLRILLWWTALSKKSKLFN